MNKEEQLNQTILNQICNLNKMIAEESIVEDKNLQKAITKPCLWQNDVHAAQSLINIGLEERRNWKRNFAYF